MIEKYEIVIIGAGPAGLACAIEAQKNDLDYVVLEKGNVVNAIIDYPVNMTFFSTADQLTLDDIPFNSQNFRPTRTEAVRYYQGLVSYYKLKVRMHTRVLGLGKEGESFKINTEVFGKKSEIRSKKVIVSTGFYDNPNRLNITGEDLPHVSHYFDDALRYFNLNVVVVGGKNSAVEAALELFRSGANVTMIHRRGELRESIKYWILPDILNRIAEGSIKAYLNSNLAGITETHVRFDQNGDSLEIPADAVFLLTGYHPDIRMIEDAGVKYDKKTLEPEIDEKTLESNIRDLYLAGAIIAGRNANRIFIENSRDHGKMIISDIINKSGR
jgi:thioredoxin reductase (NADPH)